MERFDACTEGPSRKVLAHALVSNAQVVTQSSTNALIDAFVCHCRVALNILNTKVE